MSPRHEFVRVPRRTYYPVVAPASVETLRLNRYDKWTDNDQTVISDRACVLGTWRWGLASHNPSPVVAPASVETLRLNRYDKWTDNDQTVISDRACVLGTWRWGLAHGGLPTPQVSQDPVALFIPPKLYPLLVILTTLANQWRILKSHLRVGRGQGGGERQRGRGPRQS